MRLARIIIVAVALSADGAIAQPASVTYDAVVRGMTCKQSTVPTSGDQLNCEYRVGQGLEFVIAGVGQPDAAITFVKVSGYDADFYASVGIMHGCVILKPGTRTNERTLSSGALPGMAFVSPKTGKVYRTWEECGQAARN